jgi:hypothetical protein
MPTGRRPWAYAIAALGGLGLLLSLWLPWYSFQIPATGLALAGRATGVSPVIAVAGAVAASLIVYRLLKPPGPSEIVHAAWGLWFALVGAGAVVAGGLLSRAVVEDADQVGFPADDVEWSATGSVAPPGA